MEKTNYTVLYTQRSCKKFTSRAVYELGGSSTASFKGRVVERSYGCKYTVPFFMHSSGFSNPCLHDTSSQPKTECAWGAGDMRTVKVHSQA